MTDSTESSPFLHELPLTDGGSVRLIEADPEFATLEMSKASPPGSTVVVMVSGAPLAIKVRSCRKLVRENIVTYQINGRFVSLSRAQRSALELKPRDPQK